MSSDSESEYSDSYTNYSEAYVNDDKTNYYESDDESDLSFYTHSSDEDEEETIEISNKIDSWCRNELIVPEDYNFIEPPIFEQEYEQDDWIDVKGSIDEEPFEFDFKNVTKLKIMIPIDTDIDNFYSVQMTCGNDCYTHYKSSVRYLLMIHKIKNMYREYYEDDYRCIIIRTELFTGQLYNRIEKAYIYFSTPDPIPIKLAINYTKSNLNKPIDADFSLQIETITQTRYIKNNTLKCLIAYDIQGYINKLGMIAWVPKKLNPAILSVKLEIYYRRQLFYKIFDAIDIKKNIVGKKVGFFVPLNMLNFDQFIKLQTNILYVNEDILDEKTIKIHNADFRITIEFVDVMDTYNINIDLVTFVLIDKLFVNFDVRDTYLVKN